MKILKKEYLIGLLNNIFRKMCELCAISLKTNLFKLLTSNNNIVLNKKKD